jgi:hypothetical protein
MWYIFYTMSNKRVSFSTIVMVVQIPTIKEFRHAGLGEAIWWNSYDYNSFKVSAAEDVREHLKSINFALNGVSAVKSYLATFLDPLDVCNTQENLRQMAASHCWSELKEQEQEALQTVWTTSSSSSSLTAPTEAEFFSDQLAFFVSVLAHGLMVILKRHGPRNAEPQRM